MDSEGVISLLNLSREIAGLAGDIIRMAATGKTPRVDDILPAEARSTIALRVQDARAKLKYGSTR